MGILESKAVRRSFLSLFLFFLFVGIALAGEGEEAHHVSFMMEAFRAINFVIFVFLLYKFAGQPVKNYFKERVHSIEVALKEAREAQEEAQRRAKECAEKVKGAEVELKGLLYQAGKERDEQVERVREETEMMVERIREQAGVAADLEVKKARKELQKEAAELSVGMAERLLKESFTDKDQERLLKEYATKIKGVH